MYVCVCARARALCYERRLHIRKRGMYSKLWACMMSCTPLTPSWATGHNLNTNLVITRSAILSHVRRLKWGRNTPLSWGDAIFGVISTEISAQPLYTPLRRPVVTSQNNSFPSHERLAPLSQTAYRAAAAHML